MLEFTNLSRMSTFIILFESREKILLMKSMTKIMTSWPLFQNTFILRRPGEVNFANIIKIAIT